MKCTECAHEAELDDFRYLYNPRIDSSISLRQCPGCHRRVKVDESSQTVLGKLEDGQDPWGKSAGIENTEAVG